MENKLEKLGQRNWLIGYRIAEEELKGETRSEYGASVIKRLSKSLTEKYGKGFTKTNLYSFYSFYKCFPEIFHSASGKFGIYLSWTHYRILLQVNDRAARDWYEKDAAEQTWSVRTLQRNISSQYYYRMLKTQNEEAVQNEMKERTASYQNDNYIDLVFYNYILKCFVLIDLKAEIETQKAMFYLQQNREEF